MKMKYIFISFLLTILMFQGCYINRDVEDAKRDSELKENAEVKKENMEFNIVGNTGGNVVNGGFAAIQGDWIYYSYILGKGIYKINLDGTKKIKICDDKSSGLNVLGDWIYYINVSDGFKLYKIKTDGTEKVKICDDDAVDIQVVEDWIYYSKQLYYPPDPCPVMGAGVLHKIKTDGTCRTKIGDDVVSCFNVAGEWIYYSNESNDDNLMDKISGKIYKIKTDGTQRAKINDDDSDFINVVGDCVYYSSQTIIGEKPVNDAGYEFITDSGLYKININGIGKNKHKINDGGSFVNVAGDWIYYCRLGTYKVKTDGTEDTKIIDDESDYLNVVGEWIFYRNIADEKIYRIKINGTSKEAME